MRAEYKRDMNHNYLILHGEEVPDTDSYQVRMLVGNGMPSLLKCRLQGIDGNFLIYYDITSKQSVASMYETKKMGLEDLRLIFGGFVQAMEEMAEYLMNPGQLLVQPEYMYLDVEKKKLYFCCMPGKAGDVREDFRVLTEYILPKIDHEDGDAVILGYGVYRRALEDTFHLEYVKEEIYKGRDSREKRIPESCKEKEIDKEKGQFREQYENQSGDSPWEMETANPFENRDREDGKKSPVSLQKKILFSILGASVLIITAGAAVLGFLPGLQAGVILSGCAVFLGTGMLVYRFRKKYKGSIEKKRGRQEIREIQREPIWKTEQEKESGWQPQMSAEEEMSVPQTLEEEPKAKDFGETVVLSAGVVQGPATLVSREPGELATIYLQEDMTVIGKMETAVDAVIDLPTVSRIHAKIRRRDQEYYLSDLNSRNGTAVNGRLLKEGEDYQLQNEDEVDFAQARYVFLK
ncbi:MAG: FHA domain-containing protein [Clostridiales bacterium]|nr:FHA domain-containing protein [Clostridiales bacterium]